MILIVDNGNGRVTRSEDSIMPKIYRRLTEEGDYRFSFNASDTDGIDTIFLGHLSHEKVNKPVIIECADVESFITSEYVKDLFDRGLVKKVVTKLPCQRLYDFLLNKGINELYHIPWAIDPEPVFHNKDIDVLFLCTIAKDWPYHKTRELIYSVLQDMQRKSEYNIVIGSAFDSIYKELLCRSKIFIVEGSERHAMTYKYIEGANAECLLMGDVPKIPEYAYELFYPHMIEITDWYKLPELVAANIEEKEKQGALKQTLIENFHIDKIVEMYKQVLV